MEKEVILRFSPSAGGRNLCLPTWLTFRRQRLAD
jgi:hypothetical protein